jgi:ABC-type uncharacterized transport system, ATPase component
MPPTLYTHHHPDTTLYQDEQETYKATHSADKCFYTQLHWVELHFVPQKHARKRANRNISLRLYPQEITTIVCPNGCHKIISL